MSYTKTKSVQVGRRAGRLSGWVIATAAGLLLLLASPLSAGLAQAACSNTPDASQGTDTQTVTIPSTGTYYVWSRLLAPSATSNSYYLQVDGGCAIDVGDSANISPNTWTWVNYQNGNTASVINVSLAAGTHQIIMTGREPGVGIDRLLFLTDQTCVPTGTGSNCTPAITAPTVPTGLSGTSTSSQVSLSWTASTDVGGPGLASYRLYRNSSLTPLATINAPATTYKDIGVSASTTYSYQVSAVDSVGNVSAKSALFSIATQPVPDTTPPTQPTNLAAKTISSAQINLNWSASTDNVAVTGYNIYRNGSSSPMATVTTTSFSDSGLAASTNYSYYVVAIDAAGNQSTHSTTVNATTQAATSVTDKTPPTAPTNFRATSIKSNSVSVAWSASTDNVGVAGYRIWRGNGSWSNWVNVGTVLPSILYLTNTGLNSNTYYSYCVRAYDAAGNTSASSKCIMTKTT